MNLNLEKISLNDLRQLLRDIPGEIKRRESVERKAVLAEMRALAQARGFDYHELVGSNGAAPSRRVKKVETRKSVGVKYRNPKDTSLTWAGRGRKPAWVVEWEASGKSLESLEVRR